MTTATRCPHLEGYDPLSAEQLRDPYPTWARARATAPVFWDARLGMWTVCRRDDVLAVIRDTDTFSSADAFALRRPVLPDELARRVPGGFFRPRMLVAKDPPEHTALRRLMQRAFTPKRVAALEPWIERTCHELLDAVAGSPEFDLMADYANALPLRVITRLLGFDAADAGMLRQWTEDFLVLAAPAGAGDDDGKPADAAMVARVERMLSVIDHARALIEERRGDPRDDVLSALAAHGLDDDLDVVTLALELVIAGNDTTANLICHMVGFLLEDRPLWDEVRADRSLVPAAVEETLRRRGSSKGLFRRATRDVRLGDADIRAGDVVHVLFAAAGHDDQHVAEPRRFDLHRDDVSAHVSFGRWTHFCLGAPLARLEARVALDVLLDREPGLRAIAGQELVYAPTLTTQTLLGYRVARGRP